MALVFLSRGVATPSEILGCEIIELLNELLFCHLRTLNAVLCSGSSTPSTSASPNPPELSVPVLCVRLILSAQHGLNPAALTASGS